MQQPIDRVSHVVFCFRPENLDEAAAFWTDALGVELEEVGRPELGLRVLVSLSSGIELIAPTPEGGPAATRVLAHLDAHGEGFYDLVYGVADLDATAAACERFGVRTTHRNSFADMEPWAGRFDVLDEVHLEPWAGDLRVTLGRLVPTDQGA